MSTVETSSWVGQSLPDIALVDLDGHTARLRDYSGSKLLVFMWASW